MDGLCTFYCVQIQNSNCTTFFTRHHGDGGAEGAIAPQFWGKSIQTNKAQSKSGEYFENLLSP